jgi:hypothetical protein
MTMLEELKAVVPEGSLVFKPPATEVLLQKLAITFGTCLPNDFLRFMRESNGLEERHGLPLVYSVEEILKLNEDLRMTDEYPDSMPVDDLLFFGNFYHNGDYAGFGLARETRHCTSVFRWESFEDERTYLASNLSDWLLPGVKLCFSD